MKKIINIIKRIVFGGFTLFAFNMMVSPLNINIPINVVTILFVAVFGLITLPFFSVLLLFFL